MRRCAALVLVLLCSAIPVNARERLVMGITQFPATLHPAIESMVAKSLVLGLAFRPLTAYGPDWKLVCLLCERLPSVENGLIKPEPAGKGVAVTFSLRADARWGDGVAVTADDVVFGWQVGRHPQSGVADAEIYRRIVKIDVVDSRRFTLHFDRVTFDTNAVNDLQVLPAHLERPRFEADPAAYRNSTAYDRDPTLPGLWNGPYRVVRVVQGSAIVLERNPAWGGKRPQFDQIVVAAVENTVALEASLLSGGVDMIAGELGLPLEQAVAFAGRHGDRFQVVFRPGLVYEHIELNHDDPALADRRVRQAMLLALDRQTLSRTLFDGRQPVADDVVAPLDWVHSDDVTHWPYDPARAAGLLDQAGWHLVDGVRRNAQGQRLSFDLVTTAGNRSRELVAQVLQSQWRAVGIEVKLRFQPPRVLFGDTVTHRKFQMALFAWSSAPESVPRSSLHSSSIPSAANTWSGQNYGGTADSRLDALMEAIEGELDRDRRRVLWLDLQRRYAEELPALPLFFRADAHIWPKGMTGITPTGHQDPSTLWVEDWRWE
jgi:peptide/nickel transport system substrate-binding protein